MEDAHVLRAVHARNASGHAEHALRDLARHEVAVVLAGRGDEHVGVADTRVLLELRVAAVAVDDEVATRELHRQTVGGASVLLDDSNLVAALQKHVRKIGADLSAAVDHYIHECPFAEGARRPQGTACDADRRAPYSWMYLLNRGISSWRTHASTESPW